MPLFLTVDISTELPSLADARVARMAQHPDSNYNAHPIIVMIATVSLRNTLHHITVASKNAITTVTTAMHASAIAMRPCTH